MSLCFAGLCQLRALAAFIATHLDAELVEKGNATAVHFRFLPKCLADLASIARDDPDHENRGRHFRPGVAFEKYSDAALTSAEVSHTAAPDTATVGRRPCAQTRLGAKVACEGLAIRQTKTARRRSVLGETPLSWQGNSSSRVAGGAALTISDVESGRCCRDWYFPLAVSQGSTR